MKNMCFSHNTYIDISIHIYVVEGRFNQLNILWYDQNFLLKTKQLVEKMDTGDKI
jgi:hypothetical protein